MLWPFHDSADLVLGDPLSQAREATGHGSQSDLLVWRYRFCTEFLDGLVGQQQTGQSTSISQRRSYTSTTCLAFAVPRERFIRTFLPLWRIRPGISLAI